MSDGHISLSDFAQVVKDVASSSGISAEFKEFIYELYERVLSQQRRRHLQAQLLQTGSHIWGHMHKSQAYDVVIKGESQMGKTLLPHIFLDSKIPPVIGRKYEVKHNETRNIRFELINPVSSTHVQEWANPGNPWASDIYYIIVDSINAVPSKLEIKKSSPIITFFPTGTLEEEVESSTDELPTELKVSLERMEEQFTDAFNQIDESRKEIEESIARTEALRLETNRMLASLGVQ